MADDKVSFGGNSISKDNDHSTNGPKDRQQLPVPPVAADNHPIFYEEEPIWDEAHMFPLAKIVETMQKGLPADVGVPTVVAQIIQEGTSDFILLVTSQAREHCQQEKRQKIKAEDIIWALGKLGFTNYVPLLNRFLSRYRDARSASTGNKKDSGASTSHATDKSSE